MKILPKCENANLRIMSSNLLFDKTAPDRVGKLLDNYIYYQPDIIGFQEANKFLHESLMVKLCENGYKTASAWPDPDKRRESELKTLSSRYSDVNFFPIAYKFERFDEVESQFVMYTSTWTYTKGYTLAVLRDKNTGKLLCVINTHAALLLKVYNLEGQSDMVEGAAWRADNARQLILAKDEIIDKYGNIPVFMTGDFNCGEDEELYSIITNNGMVNTKYAAKISASLDQYSYHVVGKPPINGKSPIDHIFATPENVTVLVHSIETRQEVLDASDHCMVYADVSI